MKHLQATTIALALVAAVGGINAAAETARFGDTGMVVGNKVTARQPPTMVHSGAIEITRASDPEPRGPGKLRALDVLRVATKTVPGEIVELQLDQENELPIWRVAELSTDGRMLQLTFDARDGHLLATEVIDRNGDTVDAEHEHRARNEYSSWNPQTGENNYRKRGDRGSTATDSVFERAPGSLIL